jgi:CubicO group peptidase (beta-lactamase class C family)
MEQRGATQPSERVGLVDALTLIDTWPVEHVAAAVIDGSGVIAQRGDASHVFGLASITKVLTAWTLMIAVEEGTLELDAAVDARGATLRHLLAHAGGYPFDGTAPIAPPGRRRIYSNTGIELAAQVLTDEAGIAFSTYLDEAVLAPLGLGVELRGSPAHAGFTSLDGFAPFVAELLRPRLLAPSTASGVRTVQYPTLDGVVPAIGAYRPCPWGLGVEIKGAKTGHWTATGCSPATFGHFGGAGTLCWVDPAADLALVVLTDRPFLSWRDDALVLWPRLGDAVLDAAASNRVGGAGA